MPGLRSAILTMVVDPLIWKYKRTPIRAHLAEFRACQWNTPDVFAARQAARLADLLVHAVTRVPY